MKKIHAFLLASFLLTSVSHANRTWIFGDEFLQSGDPNYCPANLPARIKLESLTDPVVPAKIILVSVNDTFLFNYPTVNGNLLSYDLGAVPIIMVGSDSLSLQTLTYNMQSNTIKITSTSLDQGPPYHECDYITGVNK